MDNHGIMASKSWICSTFQWCLIRWEARIWRHLSLILKLLSINCVKFPLNLKIQTFLTSWNNFHLVILLIALTDSSRVNPDRLLLFFNYRVFLFPRNFVWQILKKIFKGSFSVWPDFIFHAFLLQMEGLSSWELLKCIQQSESETRRIVSFSKHGPCLLLLFPLFWGMRGVGGLSKLKDYSEYPMSLRASSVNILSPFSFLL
jgi:hypothetical protein